ncbi:MAG: histidine kinase dimerization/phospho-acceptor domain-containing protein [Actinomycetota bacterium]
MKLRTRLTLGSAAVTAISTLLIGGFAITSSHNSDIALIDQSLDQVAVSVNGQSNDALSQALFTVQASNLALTLVLLNADHQATVLNESKLSVVPEPSDQDIESALLQAQTIPAAESYRLRTVQLPDGEYILVAASLRDVDTLFKSNLLHLLGFIALCLLIAGLAIWLLVRRDIKKIEQLIDFATQISDGDTSLDLTAPSGDSEVDQLATALNRMVIALRRTVEIEERATKRMQEFMGDASHELRTPLTVIKGYVELLSGVRMTDSEQRERAYSRVNSEIARMESLIQDILFLAEFGESRVVDSVEFDLSELVTAHLNDFAALNAGRQITTQIAGGIKFKGSDAHIARLLANAFGNISRHTPIDAPVQVRLKENEEEIELAIEDGGSGLSEDVYRNGIQSFQRFDRSRSRENGGSGLGMSIIFAIVHEHGGTVTLRKSNLGGLDLHIVL